MLGLQSEARGAGRGSNAGQAEVCGICSMACGSQDCYGHEASRFIFENGGQLEVGDSPARQPESPRRQGCNLPRMKGRIREKISYPCHCLP